MELTKEQFLEKYRISEETFEAADFSWEELMQIAQDYEGRRKELNRVRRQFSVEYLQDRKKEDGLQSYHSRLKDTEHLVEKLIRKRVENYAKYKNLSAENYMCYVTDLIGIRGLLLYREDWLDFHKYILKCFQNDPEKYIRDYEKDYNPQGHGYMAEPPKVHTRLGDFTDIYLNWIPECNILDRKHYRAVHYIVVYKGVYIEIQIRTLFEEGWGEIDHHILYPKRKEDPMLKEFSELLNRLAGMGDEMGSFYRRLKDVPNEQFRAKQSVVRSRGPLLKGTPSVSVTDLQEVHTFEDALNNVLKE